VPPLKLVRALAAAALLLAMMLVTRAAGAHVLGLSRGVYTPEGASVRAEIVLRQDEAATAVPELDPDGDGRTSESELAGARATLATTFVSTLEVSADGKRCAGTLDEAGLEAPDGVRLRATFACDHAPQRLHLRFGFLERLPSSHRHLATVQLPRGDVDTLAVLARPDVDVDVSSGASHGFGSLLLGGVEHILTGLDHLAFLLALLLGGTLVATRVRVGPLVAMLSAFTVGHSASLAIATLGGFAPGARFVEPAVALSVAYVGVENLFVKSVKHRWMLTLPFGFVHGFAFAGGLLPLGLPRAQLPAALLAFNLGVEAGQLAVLAVLLPPLVVLARRAWYARAARAMSVGVAIAGVVWFVERIL
jgi:hypothetical protein